MNYDPKTHNISQLHEVTSAAVKVKVMLMLAMDVVEYEMNPRPTIPLSYMR